jgi:apolipoprotein N-acyltransferase
MKPNDTPAAGTPAPPAPGSGALGNGAPARTPLTPAGILGLALLAVAAFHLGFLYAPLWWLVLVWLGCLFELRRTSCGRWAFYSGLAIGLGIYGPQLYFFWTIFGPAAVALWLVLAFWLALFVLLLHGVDRYWGTRWAVALAPVLWLGIEFFRSELYYLRFSWLTAGSFLPPAWWPEGLATLGVYGLGALFMVAAACLARTAELPGSARQMFRSRPVQVGAAVLLLLWLGSLFVTRAKPKPALLPVAGVQLEFPREAEVLVALDRAYDAEPAARDAKPLLYLLSEYTFNGPVPEEIRAWCREKQRWLVAGGKEPLKGGAFYNTAFVVSTNGEVVFTQAKSVPIQFFNDGVPAPDQRVWESPWGKLGICICYDLSYARVVDRLIGQGAEALLVPAMDTIAWGAHQHWLNARMTPIRAAEYRVPVFRVASSGISQVVDHSGRVASQLPFPGQGEILYGTLRMLQSVAPIVPWDRWLGPLAVLSTVVILIWLGGDQRRARRRPTPDPR